MTGEQLELSDIENWW